MTILKDAESIRKEFEDGQQYKEAIRLYENYELNEAFYIGDQWRGVDADDMPKPVVNGLQRVVNMHISKVVSSDWVVRFLSFQNDEEHESVSKMLSDQVDHVIERLNLKATCRTAQRNECVDGDACIHFGFDADAESGMNVPGMVTAELLENINVYFGNRYSRDVQSQPYIIVHQRRFLGDVQDEARENGVPEDEVLSIKGDNDEHQLEANSPTDLVTVLTKYWKENGTVHAIRTTRNLVIRKEWDTDYKLYPLNWGSWQIKKASYHGQAMLTGLIDNQIAINKSWAGIIWQSLKTGFSPPVVNRNVIKSWNGEPGGIIEASGPVQDVRNAVMYLEAAPVPVAIITAMDNLMSATRDCMGASDATLGNVNPDNASAIIALQQADEQPLELRKQEYHDFVESGCRIIADIMRARYGKRKVMMNVKPTNGAGMPTSNQEMVEFDFSTLDDLQMSMRVDIGASSMYSEQLQVQTLNNIFTSGIFDDPAKLAMYLEAAPERLIPARQKFKQYVEAYMRQLLQAQQPQPKPVNTIPDGFDPATQTDGNPPVQPRIENTMLAQP